MQFRFVPELIQPGNRNKAPRVGDKLTMLSCKAQSCSWKHQLKFPSVTKKETTTKKTPTHKLSQTEMNVPFRRKSVRFFSVIHSAPGPSFVTSSVTKVAPRARYLNEVQATDDSAAAPKASQLGSQFLSCEKCWDKLNWVTGGSSLSGSSVAAAKNIQMGWFDHKAPPQLGKERENPTKNSWIGIKMRRGHSSPSEKTDLGKLIGFITNQKQSRVRSQIKA